METQTFFQKYKVFLFGLAGAIALAVQAALSTNGESGDIKVYLYAALMAALSYVATQWRGQSVTILGIIGTIAGTAYTMATTGTFTWAQFITAAVLAGLSAVAPPPKPLTYEKSAEIVKAKEIPPVEQIKDDSELPIGTIRK